MKIGAQLYTLREHCTNLEDFSETLKKVADIGYEYVQVSGTCPFEPEWLKEELQKNGLKCAITHTNPDLLKSDAAKVTKEHGIFGCDYIGLGYYPFADGEEEQALKKFLDTYKPVAKEIRENGKFFMYHNHAHEFKKVNGKLIIQHIADNFEKDELGFILDTYWVQCAGGDPAEWIKNMSGRVPCIHLKDCAYGPKMAVIGEGNINFDRVFKQAEKAGTKYMLVEQDDCYGEDPFECLKRSYQNLKAFGF